MYITKFYIKPEDILERIKKDEYVFDKCIITNVEKQYDGTVELTCLLLDNKEVIIKDRCRYKLIV